MSEEKKDFKNFIQKVLLDNSGLNKESVNKLTDEQGIKKFEKAFTHKSYNVQENYEFLENIGDATLNDIIQWYFFERFPQLDNPEGVEFMARLKIVAVSKSTISNISKTLGFGDYIRYDKNQKINMSKLYTDVFEAFIACLRLQIDLRIYPGTGYTIATNFMRTLLQPFQISLDYNMLYDPNSKINEFKHKHPEVVFDEPKDTVEYSGDTLLKRHEIFIIKDDKKISIGVGYGRKKKMAEQKASQDALEKLAEMGYELPFHSLVSSKTKQGSSADSLVSSKTKQGSSADSLVSSKTKKGSSADSLVSSKTKKGSSADSNIANTNIDEKNI